MLKIIDDVDLNILIKEYEFEDASNSRFLIKSFKKNFSTDDYITIDKETKVIRLNHYQDEYGSTFILGVSDTLYDLISANLVEKINFDKVVI